MPSNCRFNPPSPCGEGLGTFGAMAWVVVGFNPPSPCGEGPTVVVETFFHTGFNPPSPCGEGHGSARFVLLGSQVSIHPPRVGRDHVTFHCQTLHSGFNPPSPCGEGRGQAGKPGGQAGFQSTLPVWGGTNRPQVCLAIDRFQSTLPVWGGTRALAMLPPLTLRFNPPSPCGEGRSFILL